MRSNEDENLTTIISYKTRMHVAVYKKSLIEFKIQLFSY